MGLAVKTRDSGVEALRIADDADRFESYDADYHGSRRCWGRYNSSLRLQFAVKAGGVGRCNFLQYYELLPLEFKKRFNKKPSEEHGFLSGSFCFYSISLFIFFSLIRISEIGMRVI